jgi:hypothetical protein
LTRKEYAREYYQKNKEMVKENSRKYRQKNIDKIREKGRKYSQQNRDKLIPYYKEYNRRNRTKRKEQQLVREYGLSSLEFKEMLERQEHRCAICYESFNEKVIYVDHNHETGEVRGLLCNLCNMGLGLFKDNTERLGNAIKYLGN